MNAQLDSLILSAIQATPAGSRARSKALSAIRWRLRSGLLYAGLMNRAAALVGPDQATVFDGRDNEQAKLRFFSAVLGCKFEIEIL